MLGGKLSSHIKTAMAYIEEKSTIPVGKSVRRDTLNEVCSNLSGKICLKNAHFNFKYNYFCHSHS